MISTLDGAGVTVGYGRSRIDRTIKDTAKRHESSGQGSLAPIHRRFVLASLLLLYFYTLFWNNLLGDKGSDVAFLTAPASIFPRSSMIHDGYFPTVAL